MALASARQFHNLVFSQSASTPSQRAGIALVMDLVNNGVITRLRAGLWISDFTKRVDSANDLLAALEGIKAGARVH